MLTHTHTQLPVVIVGGGLTGLSAATLLAQAGHDVTLFEKARHPGGRARTSQRSGFFFNQGAHAFYTHGPGERLLNELSVPYSGAAAKRSRFLALESGNLHRLPVGASSLLSTSLLNFSAKREMMGLFANLKRLNFAELQHISFQDWLDQHIQQPQLRRFLLAVARLATYTNAPELVSAGLTLDALSAQVWYLDGGWQTLVDGLQQKAQEVGARIITHARVRTIERAGEGYNARLEDGSSYAARAILLATDPETASALVLDGKHEALRKWAEQAVPVRVACLDIALRRLPRTQNIYTLGIDRPLYYSEHSASARLAPEGSSLVHVAKYLRPDESPEPEATRNELEALMDLLQPGWRAEVVEQYFLPHMITSNAMVQAKLGGLPGRPGPEIPDLPDLYVAGDWVGAEGQLADACFASARHAAGQIVAHLADQQPLSLTRRVS